MKLKITNVDMNGWLGRDHHPKPMDVGLIVTLVKLETMFYSPEKTFEPIFTADDNLVKGVLPYLNGKEDPEGETYVEQCWTCITEDGRTLELMDFEIEVVLEHPVENG